MGIVALLINSRVGARRDAVVLQKCRRHQLDQVSTMEHWAKRVTRGEVHGRGGGASGRGTLLAADILKRIDRLRLS